MQLQLLSNIEIKHNALLYYHYVTLTRVKKSIWSGNGLLFFLYMKSRTLSVMDRVYEMPTQDPRLMMSFTTK